MPRIIDAAHGKACVRIVRAFSGEAWELELDVRIASSAFEGSYSAADNRSVVATDTLRNFLLHSAATIEASGVDALAQQLTTRLLDAYCTIERVDMHVLGNPTHVVTSSSDRTTSLVAMGTAVGGVIEAELVQARDAKGLQLPRRWSGILRLPLLKLDGNSFVGFARDRWTTLADASSRPLQLELDVRWRSDGPSPEPAAGEAVRCWLLQEVAGRATASVQDLLHQVGSSFLDFHPGVVEVRCRAANHAWREVTVDDARARVFAPIGTPPGVIELALAR